MADTDPARIGDVKAGLIAVKADVKARFDQALGVTDTLAERLADVPPALATFGIQPFIPGLPNADQSAKIQAAMDAGVTDFSGMTIYVNGPLIWREGRTFIQRGGGEVFPKTQGFGDKQGAFIFGPAATRVLQQSLRFESHCFIHIDAATPPVITGDATVDTEAARLRIAGWADNGIGATFYQDTIVRNGLTVGFAVGYQIRQERIRLENCRSDNLIDYDISDASDCCYIDNPHMWPFWLAHYPGIGADALRPYERGIWLHDDPDGVTDKSDGVQIRGGLCYGRRIGFENDNCYATLLDGTFFDGPPELAAERGTIGVKTSGDSNMFKMAHVHVDSVATGYDLTHTSGEVTWHHNTASNIQVQPVLVGAGHSTGSVTVSSSGTNSVVRALDGVGLHDIEVVLAGGTITRLIDIDAVTTEKSRLQVSLQKNVGAATLDNGGVTDTKIIAASTVGQPMVAYADTLVAFTETADNLGEFSGNVFTARRSGMYRIVRQHGWQAADAVEGLVLFQLMKGATEIYRFQTNMASANLNTWPMGDVTVPLNAGETISIRATLERGGNLPAGRNLLSISRVV